MFSYLIDPFTLSFNIFFRISFTTLFIWFSSSFLFTKAFSVIFLIGSFYIFSFFQKFLAEFILCERYFFLQCNLISNYIWLTSSGGCPNYNFRRLIPEGTHDQGGHAHLTKMHLLTKSSICHWSFQTSSYLFVKKDISSIQHYFSFLHPFHDCIIAIPPPFFEIHCCFVVTWYWALWMVCNIFQFIFSVSYHGLVYKEFNSPIHFFNWVLACTGCITYPPVLCTTFSNANTCSFKFLPS